eukprot:14248783-Ditylum_brightwellii.AAC.1
MQAKKDMLERNEQRALRHEARKHQEDAIQIISQENHQHNTVAKKRELWMTLKDKPVCNWGWPHKYEK